MAEHFASARPDGTAEQLQHQERFHTRRTRVGGLRNSSDFCMLDWSAVIWKRQRLGFRQLCSHEWYSGSIASGSVNGILLVLNPVEPPMPSWLHNSFKSQLHIRHWKPCRSIVNSQQFDIIICEAEWLIERERSLVSQTAASNWGLLSEVRRMQGDIDKSSISFCSELTWT